MKVIHYVILGLTALAAVAQSVQTAVPGYAPIAGAVQAVCLALVGALGVVSPSATAPAPAPSLQAKVSAETAANLAALQATAQK